MKKFALIGAAGFIAVRHFKAIKDTGNVLVAALDKSDSVGILDSYFPQTDFFTEYERFDRHLDKLRRNGQGVDYVSICSPNYLHDAHIRFALRQNADAICEKPLVLNPWNVDALEDIQKETGKNIFTILQLRLHPVIKALKEKIDNDQSGKIHDIDLTYITSRGNWYFTSWKASEEKSGGISTNIGIHFFDMLSWIFGETGDIQVHVNEPKRAAGLIFFKKARIRWFLSVDSDTLPNDIKAKGQRTFRSILVDGAELEFSEGFTDLHTQSYAEIIAGRGFTVSDARSSIEIAHKIRIAKPLGLTGDYHPFANKKIEFHPFLKQKLDEN